MPPPSRSPRTGREVFGAMATMTRSAFRTGTRVEHSETAASAVAMTASILLASRGSASTTFKNGGRQFRRHKIGAPIGARGEGMS